MPKSLDKLENLLGYQFQDRELLERALTHRSWVYEEVTDGDEDEIHRLQNETLEFVGDSVLGLAVAEHLYKRHSGLDEGDLTLMKHRLVSTETLAKVAANIGLGDFVRIGKGEEKTGGRNKPALLADSLEAVIAAVFFDSSYVSARTFVGKLLADELRSTTPIGSLDYKTMLQETLQAEKRTIPNYTVIKTEGPPHNRTFFVEASWDNGKTRGKGNSIKTAEMEAASIALKKLKKQTKRI
ncbi:MAG: ribonuclease III [Pyrinomonadaceae bacterium]|nr:ribonuclease III [Pyrinomonadaceae bacterium]